jgi:hypothetical protein
MTDTSSLVNRRPRTIAEMNAALARLVSEDSLQRGLAFRARPSDVFITTYPKCGTTWMQQIVHGLRSRGSMDFEEITEVVPWLEIAHDMGIDPERQAWEPRVLKTHCPWHGIPRGGRYIYVIRDPGDVLISFYHFFENWMFEPGAVSLDTFTREFFITGSRSGRYWEHLRSWWPRLGADDTLMVCYEDMKHDLGAVVERVARFLGLSHDPALLDIATRQASFAFMHAHERQFDDHLLRQARDAICGLPAGQTSKIRAGRVGDQARELSSELAGLLDEIWRDEIAAPLGLPSYAALRARVASV